MRQTSRMPRAPRPRGGRREAILRAARAWSDIERAEFGAKLGYSAESVSRMEAGSPLKTATQEDAVKWVVAAGLPERFAEVGFDFLTEPISDSDALVYALRAEVAELRDAVSQLASGLTGQEVATAVADFAQDAVEVELDPGAQGRREEPSAGDGG
jgi:hypothetical protein